MIWFHAAAAAFCLAMLAFPPHGGAEDFAILCAAASQIFIVAVEWRARKEGVGR